MRWKNIDTEAGYSYITGTVVEWLPLFNNVGVGDTLCARRSAELWTNVEAAFQRSY